MNKYRIWAVILLVLSISIGWFVYSSEKNPDSDYRFSLGLDLNGGTELVYKADTSEVASSIDDAMASLRDVIERRVNIFGVSEPVVQTEKPGIISGSGDYRLRVELPGITDIEKAKELIGKTPSLEFMLVRPGMENLSEEELLSKTVDELFVPTGLTGKYLEKATLQFSNANQGVAGEPMVVVRFNKEGEELFSKITKENINKVLAIFLDGSVISSPVIRDQITDGEAVISGNFLPEEAKSLVRDLNYGALPLPIELVSNQKVGASMGVDEKQAGLKAGIIGFAVLSVFLLFWYRLPGLVSVVALLVYVAISLTLFKLIPVTLTSAGIAGFILSIGMAVDANVLIFERLKEELKKGKSTKEALESGFSRAWLSIRDSNISSMITATILFWIGTSAVKGFALTFGLGVLVSMFTAITVSRTFLFSISGKSESRFRKFLFGSGMGF